MAVLAAVLRSNDADVARWSRELGRASVQFDRGSYDQSSRRLQSLASNDVSDNQSNSSHLKSSSVQRPQLGVESPVSASLSVARTAQTSREEVRKQLETALTTCVPQYREPAKQVAARLEQSVGKVASIRRKIPEGMIDAALMCVHYPEFAKAWARVTLMESDLHPEAARALNDFVTAIQRRGK